MTGAREHGSAVPGRARALRRLAPGLALAACAAAVALAAGVLWPVLSPLTIAIALGVIVGNALRPPASTAPGLELAARRLLRAGVVLLGLRLVIGDVVALGPGAAVLVLGVAATTFFGILGLARLLGVGRGLGLLTGTGFAICGASAIAAAHGIVDAEEEDLAASVGLVLLFGTLSIALLPVLGAQLGLDDALVGAWIGVAVHDVGQTVAAAGAAGPGALEVAVVVKLGRVLLLGPLLVGLTLFARRTGRGSGRRRGALVPLFVVGFVAAVAVRSLGWLPTAALEAAGWVERFAFAMALFALGTGVRWSRLRRLGPRPVLLGTLAYGFVLAFSLAAVLLLLSPAGSGR